MEKNLIECGKIVSTQGIRGEVRIQPWCDSPDFLCSFKAFFARGGALKLEVQRIRVNKNIVVAKFKDFDSVEAAQSLRNHVIYIERKSLKLKKGTHLVCDLIGLEVVNSQSGKVYGKLCNVTATGARDVYHIKTPNGRELLFPAIPEVIVKTDISGGRMEILPLKGLFDDED